MEYVSRCEVKPYRDLFELTVVPVVREACRDEGLTFECHLVGSARRNLVVRHPNKGFDCDYQIIIRKNENELSGESIKSLLISLFNQNMPNTFKKAEDSTSAITVKQIRGNTIKFSYDIVILRERADGLMEILRRVKNKERYNYVWNILPNSAFLEDRIKQIEMMGYYDDLRELYFLKKTAKNNGRKYEDRKSYQLLNEAVNEVLGKHNIHY